MQIAWAKKPYKTIDDLREINIIFNKKSKNWDLIICQTKEILKSFDDKKEAIRYHNKIIIGQFIETL